MVAKNWTRLKGWTCHSHAKKGGKACGQVGAGTQDSCPEAGAVVGSPPRGWTPAVGSTQLSPDDTTHSASSLLEPEGLGHQLSIRRPQPGCSPEDTASPRIHSATTGATVVCFLILDRMTGEKRKRHAQVRVDVGHGEAATLGSGGRSWKDASGEAAGVTNVGPAGNGQHFITSFFTPRS